MSWWQCQEAGCEMVWKDDSPHDCPVCGSDYVSELVSCELCGGPVLESGTRFCKGCGEAIDEGFASAVDELDWYDHDRVSIVDIFVDRMEERNFYKE